MELKSILLGGFIGLLAGGGIYGLYVKNSVKITTGEGDAIGLMGECAVLRASQPVSPSDAERFISKVKAEAPQIFASLAVAGAVAGQSNARTSTAAQVNGVLNQCVQDLQKSIAKQ